MLLNHLLYQINHNSMETNKQTEKNLKPYCRRSILVAYPEGTPMLFILHAGSFLAYLQEKKIALTFVLSLAMSASQYGLT